MMVQNDRTRGVIVQVLDLSALEADALTYRQKTHPDCYEAKIHGGKIAVATSKHSGTGHLYAICTEGVGPEYGVSDDDPLEIEFHGSYHVRDESGEVDPHKHTFDMLPFAATTLNPTELRSYPILEEVDLADFIRKFGNRLEVNYWNWYQVLS